MLPESITLGLLLVTLFAAFAFALALGGAQRRRREHGFDSTAAPVTSSDGRSG
jgi:hypothetical protein